MISILKDYVVNYTDAPFLVNEDFKMPGELDGVFSGYNEHDSKYDKKSWAFQLDDEGVPKKDIALQDPNCVFQLLKKHYSRYTLEKVSEITGTPADKCEAVYKIIGSTHRPDTDRNCMLRHGLDTAHGGCAKYTGLRQRPRWQA